MDTILVLKYLACKPKILNDLATMGGMARQSPLITLAHNVATLRKQMGINQTQLAHRAGISQKVVSNVERAHLLHIFPTMETISAIASALNVPDYVLLMPVSDVALSHFVDISMERMIDTYVKLPPDSRRTVDRILSLESRGQPSAR